MLCLPTILAYFSSNIQKVQRTNLDWSCSSLKKILPVIQKDAQMSTVPEHSHSKSITTEEEFIPILPLIHLHIHMPKKYPSLLEERTSTKRRKNKNKPTRKKDSNCISNGLQCHLQLQKLLTSNLSQVLAEHLWKCMDSLSILQSACPFLHAKNLGRQLVLHRWENMSPSTPPLFSSFVSLLSFNSKQCTECG